MAMNWSFVEDEVAKGILQAALPTTIRSRITITVVGSATALARQLAASYVRKDKRSVIAVFDGDQRVKESDNRAHAQKMVENPKPDFDGWFDSRICYLPGETLPEAWLIQKSGEAIDALSAVLSTETEALQDILEYGLQAGKHNEFHEMSKHLGLEQSQCLTHFSSVICSQFHEELSEVINLANNWLNEI